MEYKYYVIMYNGLDTLYKIQKGRIGDSVKTLEVYHNGIWNKELRLIKYFMNQYVTGWLDEDDAMDYDEAIRMFSNRINEAKSFAIENHNNQKYGIYPYEIHLINVINVFLSNNILPTTEENIDLWIGAWLHDILEDTSISKQVLEEKFGTNISEMVWSLTDGPDGDRKEKKQVMFQKLVLNQKGIIIKLADRIANLEFSIINGNKDKVKLYIDENDELNKYLSGTLIENTAILLLNYLNRLVMLSKSIL